MNAQPYGRDSELLRAWQAEATAQGRECVVAGLMIRGDGRTFVQKRSANRRLFPECWDIVGGHVEAGETLYTALAREIEEETGWTLRRIVDLVTVFDWSTEEHGRPQAKREFDFLVEVDGDLAQPQIEAEKFSEWRWVGSDEVELLKENRNADDQVIYQVVTQALEMAQHL